MEIVTHHSMIQQSWVAKAGQFFKGHVWGGANRLKSYFSLSQMNDSLARENSILQGELLQAREMLRAVRLDTMKLRQQEGFSSIHAEILKISRNKQHNYIVLNRGFEDGIMEKSGIITAKGVVGIVTSVSAHHAYAMSFQNNDISISARLGKEGGSGLLVWDGVSSNGAILKEIPLQYLYSPGDTVYTSGHSLLFPPDIPLGTAGQSKVRNGSTNEISIRLFQDFKELRYVTVVHNNSFEEIIEFEQ